MPNCRSHTGLAIEDFESYVHFFGAHSAIRTVSIRMVDQHMSYWGAKSKANGNAAFESKLIVSIYGIMVQRW